MKEWAMNEIIKKLGFEHPMVVWFISVCEENPNADDEKSLTYSMRLLTW